MFGRNIRDRSYELHSAAFCCISVQDGAVERSEFVMRKRSVVPNKVAKRIVATARVVLCPAAHAALESFDPGRLMTCPVRVSGNTYPALRIRRSRRRRVTSAFATRITSRHCDIQFGEAICSMFHSIIPRPGYKTLLDTIKCALGCIRHFWTLFFDLQRIWVLEAKSWITWLKATRKRRLRG